MSAILVRQSRSPEDREIARRFAPLWKVLSTMPQEKFPGQDTESPRIVPSIDFRGQVLNMFDRRNGIGVPNSCVASFLLVCLHLIFLTTFCNKWLVKHALRLRIARPMCDGRPFASSLFRRLAIRGLFFLGGALILWPLQVAIYLCIRLFPNDHVPHRWKTNQIRCKRPYDTLTCHLHTATWLGRSQSILTQLEHISKPEDVCCRVSPLSLTICWPMEPDFFEWPLIQPEGPMQAEHAPSREDANVNLPGYALLGPSHQRWRRDALQPDEVLRAQQMRDTCVHFPAGGLRCVSWNTRGLLGSTASSQISGN